MRNGTRQIPPSKDTHEFRPGEIRSIVSSRPQISESTAVIALSCVTEGGRVRLRRAGTGSNQPSRHEPEPRELQPR